MAVAKEVLFDVQINSKGRRGKCRQIGKFRKAVKLNNSKSTTSINSHDQQSQDGRNTKAVKVICNRDKDGRIKKIRQSVKQLKGKVAFTDEGFHEDVKVLVRKVADLGAAAVFVSTDPGIVLDIPVFVVQKHVLMDMANQKSVEVSFKSVSAASGFESSSEDSDSDINISMDHFSVKTPEAEVKVPVPQSSETLPTNRIRNSLMDPEEFIPSDCVQGVGKSMRKEIWLQIEACCQGQAVPSSTFHIKVSLSQSAAVNTFHLTHLNLVRAICERWREQVVGIENSWDVKGAIAYPDQCNPSDMQVIVESLAMHGAMAVFVYCDPDVDVSFDIPLFVLTRSDFDTLARLKNQDFRLRVKLRPDQCDSVMAFEYKNEDVQFDVDQVGLNRANMDKKSQVFSITIKCSLNGNMVTSINTVKSSEILSSSTAHDDCCYQNIALIEAVWPNGRLANKNEIEGKIIFSQSKDASIILSIAHEGAKHGAVALFTSMQPGECCELPVFVLNEAEFRRIRYPFVVSVDLEPIYQYSFEGGTAFTDDAIGDHEKKESSKEKTLLSIGKELILNPISSFSNAFKSLFEYKPTVEFHLKEILSRRCDWSAEEGLQSFSEALDIIQRAQCIQDHSLQELLQIAKELTEHMEQSCEVDILVVGYATYLLSCCEKEGCGRYNGFRRPLDQVMRKMTMDVKCAKLCRLVHPIRARLSIDPISILSDFVLFRLQRMGQGEVRGKMKLENELLVKLVWIAVHHCDISFGWWDLNLLVDPAQFPPSRDCRLGQILGVVPLQTLGLHVQTCLDDFCNVLDKMYMASAVPVPILFEREMQFLIPLLRSPFELKKLNKSLDQFRFHDPNNNLGRKINGWKQKVVSEVVVCTLRARGNNLMALQQVLESVDVEHSYHDLYRQEIVKTCSRILQPNPRHSRIPSIDNVINALEGIPLGTLLASKDLFSPMKHYTNTALKYPARDVQWKEKITLIEKVYSSLRRVQAVDPADISLFLLASLRQIMHSGRLDFFWLASKKRDFFYSATDKDLVSIVELAWEGSDVVGNIETLKKLPLAEFDEGMMVNLRKKLCDILCNSFADFEKWIAFYIYLEPNASVTLKSILHTVFLHFVEQWNPNSFLEIVSLNPRSLCAIRAFFSGTESAHETVSRVRTQMINTCSEWIRKHKCNSLPYNEIERVRDLYSKEHWTDIERIIEMKLIGQMELQESLRQIDDLLASIQLDTRIELFGEDKPIEHMPLIKVFSKYSCDFKSGNVGTVLSEWNDFPAKVFDVKQTFLFDDIKYIAELLADFRSSYQSEINIAHYMGSSDCMLFHNEIDFRNWIPVSIEIFLGKVSDAKRNLRSLVKCDGEDPCASIKKAFDLVASEKRDLIREIEKLSSCPDFQMDKTDMMQFRLLVSLVTISSPLQVFVECCEQLNFTFVRTDKSFQTLSEISDVLDFSGYSRITVKDACGIASQIVGAISSPKNHSEKIQLDVFIQDLVPFFTGLGFLSSSSDVWTLVREMKWFGEEGRKQFNEEYSNVTNQLLFADSETYESNILNALDPVVRFVSFLGSLLGESSFKEFYIQTKDLDELLHENLIATRCDIQLVQENVSNIREWFDSGIDDTLAIFSRFNQVWQTGQYIIRDDELCLRYSTSDRQSHTLLSSGDLGGFVQQLGFVQQENQDLSSQITLMIEQYQVLTEVVTKCAHATSVGYEFDLLDSFPYCVQNQLMDARILLDQATKMILECDTWLENIRSSAPLSLLYWTKDLRIVYEALMDACNLNNGEHLDMLLPKLAALICHEMHKTIHDELSSITLKCLVQFKANFDTRDRCWLRSISQFLEGWYSQLTEVYQSKPTQKVTNSGIFLHSFECDENQKPLLLLCAIQHIYKGRMPESYEVLDGMFPCTAQKMHTFLARVKAFPGSLFTVLNVQDLPGELQEYLLNFMSRTDQSCRNFHCVQLSDTILHSSPWVEQVVWNKRSLCHYDLTTLKSKIIDHLYVERMILVLGASGSGKTRWIRDEMKNLQRRDDKIHVLSISIHEGTDVHSIVESMKRIPCTKSSKIAIHFSFMVPLNDSCEHDWVKALNYFFNMLLLTRSIYDPVTGEMFFIGWQRYHIYVELQGIGIISEKQESLFVTVRDELSTSIPILAYCSTFQVPPKRYHIDDKARRVCTYLRALKNGTIDRKFGSTPPGKQLMFVIDKSSSMGGSRINMAIDNALKIFDSHICIGDVFGTLLFDRNAYVAIPLQKVTEGNIHAIRSRIDRCRTTGFGTRMFSALHTALLHLQRQVSRYDSWIICLTDGASSSFFREEFRRDLCASPSNLHVMIIGVDLYMGYQEYLRALCTKFGAMDTEGAFFASEADAGALNNAFQSVAARIPVSQTFELDGSLTDRDCRALIGEYLPNFLLANDMTRTKFWIEFLYRRVKVFDGNEHFNYNETYDHLGSSLMSIMLCEASRLLSPEHNRNWKESNHEQLIYDFTKPHAPEFRLICTAPDRMRKETIDRFKCLDLPGFFIPSCEEIKTRECLDLYLSQALNVPLVPCKDGSQRLSCIDENEFVLTLDFTMKILNMHERIACHVPCIIEGETGVSKTALTLMYSILMNSSLTEQARKHTRDAMKSIEQELLKQGFLGKYADMDLNPLNAIRAVLVDATNGTMQNSPQLEKALRKSIIQYCDQRSCIFKNVPDDLNTDAGSILDLLQWFSASILERTFFELNVDASLEEYEIINVFNDVCKTARKVASSGAVIVVFLDEFNTSSVIGLFKEIIIDRSFCGEPLEPNVVIVAACNPAGRQSLSAGLSRESDLAKEWASGHYQVNKLPESMACLKWNYGALNPEQEKEFVCRRIEMLNEPMPFYLIGELTEIITTSQEAIRSFAAEDIKRGLDRISYNGRIEDEAANRARSAVSLRDIQRVFTLFRFFTVDFPTTRGKSSGHFRASMLLTVAIVYYFKLDRDSRKSFLDEISKSLANPTLKDEFLTLLDQNMMAIVKETIIPDGIALTDGLKENIFMTLICSLSCTPLVIVGPPGSSKTLSLNILDSNTNGEESPSKFYRQLSRLSTYHYQCSKTSTSKEVASVFDKAIQRQMKVDPQKHKCLVFMDEAGLPEEEKESLKVLHYYLEGHMSTKASVSFVAITNHVLDAAKSNRCVSLLRQEPDKDEMSQVVEGVLFSSGKKSQSPKLVRFEERTIPGGEFASSLCSAYKRVLSLEGYGFETFFGLRDFIYFLQYVRHACKTDDIYMKISQDVLIDALERNFNGIPSKDFKALGRAFLQHFVNHEREIIVRKSIDVVRSALKPAYPSKVRYTLIIDESNDDSIMRLLQSEGLLHTSKNSLFKLSNMPENTEMEQLNLVSRVKFAAQKGGGAVILSQTERVNESFYDLFNQNFRRVPNRDGEECLFANIAVGGVSRRSRVSASFRCVMHVRAIDLENAPAPFLNRFEKYRLSIKELLSYKLERSSFLSRIVERAQNQIERFCSIISLCGFVPGQTTESIFLDLFYQAPILRGEVVSVKPSDISHMSFYDVFGKFANDFIGIYIDKEDFDQLCSYGVRYLPMDQAEVLGELIKKEALSNRHNIVEAFNECLFLKPQVGLAIMIERLFEMFITRMILGCLLQLASPEEIFKKRDTIPFDLVDEYFHQEHFSLKPFVQSAFRAQPSDSKIRKYIVHTRSNGQIMGVPTIRVGEKQSQKLQFVHTFIHPRPERVMIEHLNLLKNESSLRSSIDTWCNDDSIDLLVMVVDMGNQVSTERVNFLRCYIDQVVSEKRKIFISILHYPVSAFSAHKFYPALFLDKWKHIYLDSIGDKEGLSGDMKNLVRKTCHTNMNKNVRFDIGKMTHKIMTEAIKSTVNMSIIYPEQLSLKTSENAAIFHARCEFLSSMLSRDIEGATIKDHLIRQFSDIWSDGNLAKVLHRATWSLQNGISQLGLTSCLKSIMQDVMGTFMLNFLSQWNEWKNFDLLCSCHRIQETDHLFFSILSSLPTIPFEELLLHKSDCTHKKQKQLPDAKDLEAKFPFFSLINTMLDEVIESTFQNIPQDNEASSVLATCSTGHLLHQAMRLLEERSNETLGEIALRTIVHVKGVEVLYLRYLEQFLSWILLCSPASRTAQWFRDKLHTESASSPDSKWNLLLIHITARKYEIELIRLSSFCLRMPLWDEATVTMQKLEQDRISLIRKGDSDVAFAFDGSGLVDATTKWFVAHLDELITGNTKCRWMDLFPMFKNAISDMLGDQVVTNIQIVRSLRLLSFFYVLKANESTPQDLGACAKSVYDHEKSLFLPDSDTTIEALVQLSDTTYQSEEWKSRCIKDLLRQFFSPQWLSKIEMFWEDDLTFMVKYLIDVGDESLLLKLTRNACTYSITSRNLHGNNSKDQINDKVLNLSISRLKFIDSLLYCTGSSGLAEDELRKRIPHFIPQFAKSFKHFCEVKELSRADKDEEINLFFMNYDSTFSGMLPEVVFQIVLEKIINLSEGQTSDKLLLALSKDIHNQCKLTFQEQSRVHRTYARPSCHNGKNSLAGTALSVMIIESRLLCFLLRVAYEIANGLPIPALQGSYSKQGRAILHNIMSIPNTRWQEIFMLHIIHISGEARLWSLLRDESSLLGTLDWAEAWRGGLPIMKDGIDDRLEKAERKLREVEAEELKKSTEMRLCPHCHQPFFLLAENCGQFVCGHADTHTRPLNGPLGCGRNFRLSETQYYNVDENRLAPLRSAVSDEKKKLQEHQTKSKVWDWMWGAELPYLSSAMTNDHNHFTPLSIAVTTIGKDSDIVRHVIDSKVKASTFQMLPQLIELYVWLHSTFGSIISHDQASSLRIGDIMNKELLCKRFDSIHVEHLLSVWETVRDSLNNHLTFCDHKINWDCETLEVPFRKIEDSSLIMLLSVSQHPTDGYDYLFIIINQIIGQFNEFMRKLHINQRTILDKHSIQPRSLLSRTPAGISLKALNFISSPDLHVMVDSFRLRNKDEYDVAGLEKAILDELSRCQFVIENPLSFLRIPFRFREDISLQTIDASKAGLKSSVGTYFVHHQDLQLFEDCQRVLKEVSLQSRSYDLKQTFMAKFHQLGYEELRGILTGLTNALNTFSFSVDETLAKYISAECSLLDLGFPQLSESQGQLINSLLPYQLAEFICHVGYQLASEAYNFIVLPISMNSDISSGDRDTFRENIEQLVNSNGKEDVLKCLNEFRDDILYLYQLQIRDHCAYSNDGMKQFLEVNNFCDDSDVIFAALPDSVTVRNYIPLQQELHQLTLQMMTEGNIMNSKKERVMFAGIDLEFAKPRRGKCWLFQTLDGNDVILSDEEDLSTSLPKDDDDRLWFEGGMVHIEQNACIGDDEGMSASSDGYRGHCISRDNVESVGIDDIEDVMSIESTIGSSNNSKNRSVDDGNISISSESYHNYQTGSRDIFEKASIHAAASFSEIENDHKTFCVGDGTTDHSDIIAYDNTVDPVQSKALPFISKETVEHNVNMVHADNDKFVEDDQSSTRGSLHLNYFTEPQTLSNHSCDKDLGKGPPLSMPSPHQTLSDHSGDKDLETGPPLSMPSPNSTAEPQTLSNHSCDKDLGTGPLQSMPSPHQTLSDHSGNKDLETGSPQSMPSPHSTAPTLQPLSEEQIKLKAKAMTAAFMENPNANRLLLAIYELNEYPGAIKLFVESSMGAALSCTGDERAAIMTIISALFANGIIDSEDIAEPLGNIIEFIEDDINDSPRAVEYLGDMIAEFLHIKAIDVTWLCIQAEKLEEFAAHLIPKIIGQIINSVIIRFNLEEAKLHFASPSSKLLLKGLLGKEKWNEIVRTAGMSS